MSDVALKPTSTERLAFLLPNMRVGGAERVALTIIRDFVQRGYPVDLVLVKAEGELLKALPPSVTIIDLKARRLAGALFPLVRYFRARRPHAIQIRMWPLTIIGLIAHRLARSTARVVISDHVALTKQYGHLPRTFMMLKASVRLLYPLANERILVSAGAADDIAALSGLPRENFRVVYNPVPHPDPAPVPPEIETLWAGCDGRVISVGSLKAQKNHALLIQAFARLRRQRNARLIILGEGSLRAELEAQVEREGLTGSVLLPGLASDPSLYLAAADLFVLSSDYEGFGNVIIEAMRLGLSVVSTDCQSGPREILADGQFGQLVPCGDEGALAEAMDHALQNPSNPARMKERAEALSGQASIDSYLTMMLGHPQNRRA